MMTSLWKQRWMNMALITVRIVLGCVFIYASWHKIARPAEFAQSIANYQLLPKALINPAALLLPWVELVCGVGLVLGILRRGSSLVISSLLLVFITALVLSLVRGLDIHCGCFSSSARAGSNLYLNILLDSILLVMAVATFIFPGKSHKIGIQPFTNKAADGPNNQ